MNVTLLSTRIDGDTKHLTPELQAATLARYSRSAEGIAEILSKVDFSNPDASVERIFRFTDYGHASIGGLTGSISMAIDGVTMVTAYLLFLAAPHADGQESSTRYLKFTEESLPSAEQIGASETEYIELRAHWLKGLELYNRAYEVLDRIAREEPERTRIPADVAPKVRERMLKNFALDRARNFLPFALRTNIALVQTARAWVDTCAKLYSFGLGETTQVANAIVEKLRTVAPHLIKHAVEKPGMKAYFNLREDAHPRLKAQDGCKLIHTKAWFDIQSYERLTAADIDVRLNRYDACSPQVRRATGTLFIPSLAIAELRDLNRHRIGERQAFLWEAHGMELPVFPEEIPGASDFVISQTGMQQFYRASKLLPWTLTLGAKVPFLHTMSVAQFVYEVELRTGPGAHFRYAEHFRDAVKSLYGTAHEGLAAAIRVGEAEPE